MLFIAFRASIHSSCWSFSLQKNLFILFKAQYKSIFFLKQDAHFKFNVCFVNRIFRSKNCSFCWDLYKNHSLYLSVLNVEFRGQNFAAATLLETSKNLGSRKEMFIFSFSCEVRRILFEMYSVKKQLSWLTELWMRLALSGFRTNKYSRIKKYKEETKSTYNDTKTISQSITTKKPALDALQDY